MVTRTTSMGRIIILYSVDKRTCTYWHLTVDIFGHFMRRYSSCNLTRLTAHDNVHDDDDDDLWSASAAA